MRRLGALCAASFFVIALLWAPARGADRIFSVTNNSGKTISSIAITIHDPVYPDESATYSVSIPYRTVQRFTLPDQASDYSGASHNVSALCNIDVQVNFLDGNSYWLRNTDLCTHPYVEALSTLAGAYTSYAYATPQPGPTSAPVAQPSPSATPSTPDGLAVDRGAQLFVKGRYAESMPFFDQAVKLNPRNSLAFAYQSRTQFLMNHFDKSLSAADKGLVVDPSSALLHWIRANTEWAMGIEGSAADDYETVFQEQPDLRSYLTMQAALVERGNGDAARAHALLVACKKLCNHKLSSYSEIRYLLGEITAPALLKSAKESWARTDAHTVIGITLFQHHDTASARPHLQWVVQNGPVTNNWTPIVQQYLHRMR